MGARGRLGGWGPDPSGLVALLCLAPACTEPRPSCPPDEALATPVSPFTIEPLAADAPEGLRMVFSRRVEVFGLEVLATEGVSEAKQLHAAHVLAEYLDNDEDGVVDDPMVGDQLASTHATMVMFCTEAEAEWGFDHLFEALDDRPLQDLYASETHPGSLDAADFDATLEETLNLVTHAGWAQVYPGDWGEAPGSAVADAMDLARGGRFLEIPGRYPAGSWYHYDDPTCDYGCMVTEYVYWSLTSLLGAQSADPERCSDIAVEWEACSPQALQAMDPGVWHLLTNDTYAVPSTLPDGRYREGE